METLYGESPEYLYEDQGGIAVMSDDSPGTVSGGSRDDPSGVVGVPTRILWTITNLGNGQYSGGITGVDPFIGEYSFEIAGTTYYVTGPFYDPNGWMTPNGKLEELYNHAINNNNRLDQYFQNWNADATNVSNFITYLRFYTKAASCAIPGTSSS